MTPMNFIAAVLSLLSAVHAHTKTTVINYPNPVPIGSSITVQTVGFRIDLNGQSVSIVTSLSGPPDFSRPVPRPVDDCDFAGQPSFGSCFVYLTFTPTIIGSQTAILSVTDTVDSQRFGISSSTIVVNFTAVGACGAQGCPTPTPTPTPTPSPTPSPTFNLSLSSQISFEQPVGTSVPQDSSGDPTIATATPPNANPAPATSPVQTVIFLTVNMSGTPPIGALTIIQVMLGSQVLASQVLNVSQLHSGANSIPLSFTPPTDPGLLGTQHLTAVINSNPSFSESTYADNSVGIDIDLMVLCKVEDSGTTVPFYAQGGAGVPWSSQAYGIPANSSYVNPTMQKFGCSVADLAMLFSSYGILDVPHGSPTYPATTIPFNPPNGLNGGSLNPGSLDYAMANYTTNFISVGSVGFDSNNDPLWAGAAEIARADYLGRDNQAQCNNGVSSCDPNNASNVVSYKKQIPAFANEQAAIAGIQNELCGGNPVILKFGKAAGGQHFMLATGIIFDAATKAPTLRLNNPGTSLGNGQLYARINTKYPTLIGGSLFHPSADPTMMYLTAPLKVHFVVTDPQGRKTGYDPTSNTTYSNIPGATYEVQSIDTPNEIGFTPETLVAERYFISSNDVLTGDYQIQVFAVSNGSFYLDYRGYDTGGTTNNSIVRNGTLNAGQSTILTIKHSDQAMPVPNAKIILDRYSIHSFKHNELSDSRIKISGNIIPNVKSKLIIGTGFKLMIGGVGQYRLSLPTSVLKTRREHQKEIYEYESKLAHITIDDQGRFDIEIRDANLNGVIQSQMGLVTINIGNIIAQVNSNITCEQEQCSLERDKDHDHH